MLTGLREQRLKRALDPQMIQVNVQESVELHRACLSRVSPQVTPDATLPPGSGAGSLDHLREQRVGIREAHQCLPDQGCVGSRLGDCGDLFRAA